MLAAKIIAIVIAVIGASSCFYEGSEAPERNFDDFPVGECAVERVDIPPTARKVTFGDAKMCLSEAEFMEFGPGSRRDLLTGKTPLQVLDLPLTLMSVDADVTSWTLAKNCSLNSLLIPDEAAEILRTEPLQTVEAAKDQFVFLDLPDRPGKVLYCSECIDGTEFAVTYRIQPSRIQPSENDRLRVYYPVSACTNFVVSLAAGTDASETSKSIARSIVDTKDKYFIE